MSYRLKASVRNILGLEAIDFQGGRSNLFSELSNEIAELIAVRSFNDKKINSSGLSTIIKKHTGILTDWHLDTSLEPNAYVYPPDININNPLLNNMHRNFTDGSSLKELLKQTNSNKAMATVDLANGKVYGCFQKMECRACLTAGLLKAKDINPDEIAGIILHEIGHIFTFMEYTVGTVTLNYATATAMKEICKTNVEKERIGILTEFENVTQCTLDNKETIVGSDDQGVIYCQLMSQCIKKKRDETGMSVYSLTSCEFVADQFAARHGAGFAVAKGLDIIYNRYGIPEKKTWAMGFIGELFSYVLEMMFSLGLVAVSGAAVPAIILSAVTITLFSMLLAYPDNIYDTPKDRVSRIIREYNVALKNTNIKDEMRQYYLSEISKLKELEDSLRNHVKWTQLLWNYVIPHGKKVQREIEFQKDIEKLANNSIFAASAAFKTA